MKARAVVALVALFVIAGRSQAGSVDKVKLRELAQLPVIHIGFGFGFSTISGFGLGEKTDQMAAIARLQKQMKGDPSDAERYLLISRHYVMGEREKEADEASRKVVAICRQQLREHPEDIAWRIRLGDALDRIGETKESENLLRRVVQEAPKKWRAWLALAECVDSRASQAIFGDKRVSFTFHNQQPLLSALSERKPTEKQIAEMRQLWKEASRYFARAVELAPGEETLPYFRRIASNSGHVIIDETLRIVKGNGVKSKGERINLAAVFLAPENIPDMRRIARLSPKAPQVIGSAMFWEIMVCVYQNKMELKTDLSSWADYLAVRARSLVDVLPAESRTFVCWCLERVEQLSKQSDKGTAAAALEILAIWLMGTKDLSESLGVSWPIYSKKAEATKAMALEHLRRAVRLDPSRERAWDMLTAMLAIDNQIDEAIAVARRRIDFKDNAHNRFLLAKVYTDGNQFDKAAEELRSGLKDDPKDLNCRLGLLALALKGETAQSLQEAGEQLKDLFPRIKEEKNKRVWLDYYVLAGICAALNDRPEWAKDTFQRLLQQNRGEPMVTRALVALGEPLGPAHQQLAIDYINERSGSIRRKDDQAASPVERIHIAAEDLFVLTAFPELRELDLSFSDITDSGLAKLTDLTALRTLILDGTKITNLGLLCLKPLRELRYLSLNSVKITDAGLSNLEPLQNLEKLDIGSLAGLEERGSITDKGLAYLHKLPKLQSVSVGSSITDKGLDHLSALPGLRRLIMLSSKITDEGMRHLEKLTELEELWLSGAEITDAGLVHLRGLRNLKKLHLGGTKITNAGLGHLKELSQLEELELDSTAVSDAGLAHLRGLTKLRKLNLSDSDRKKESLTVSQKPPLTGEGLKHLQGLTKLKYLDLDGRPITDTGLTDIERLTEVEYLSLDTTSITDEGLAHLRPLKQLHLVNVKSTKVTRQGVAELRKALPKLEVYR